MNGAVKERSLHKQYWNSLDQHQEHLLIVAKLLVNLTKHLGFLCMVVDVQPLLLKIATVLTRLKIEV